MSCTLLRVIRPDPVYIYVRVCACVCVNVFLRKAKVEQKYERNRKLLKISGRKRSNSDGGLRKHKKRFTCSKV